MSEVPILKKLQEKFFNDPDWAEMEKIIEAYIAPLRDMSTIDLKQPAEHVKAEVMGRMYAHESMRKFLDGAHVISKGRLPEYKNPFE